MVRIVGGKYLYDGTTGSVFRAGRSIIEATRRHLGREGAAEPGDGRRGDRALGVIRAHQRSRKLTNAPIAGYAVLDADAIASVPTAKITVSVTTRCNLRCGYCPYARRSPTRLHRVHGRAKMSPAVARATVRFILERLSEETAIGFYGGEPLLHMGAVASIVGEVRKARPRWSGSFTITTNLTAYSREIGDFLARNRFLLFVSLDGPKDVHDRHRRTSGGGGSFERVLEHLRDLRRRHPDYFARKVCTNTVLVPPLDLETVDRFIAGLGCSHAAFRPVAGFRAGEPGGAPDRAALRKASRDLQRWAVARISAAADPVEVARSPLLRWLCSQHVGSVAEPAPTDERGLRPFKTCIPGARPMIATDGNVSLCEQCETIGLGDVFGGVDVERARALVRSWQELLADDCLRCWASAFCDACYASAWDGSGFRRALLRRHCVDLRRRTEAWLELFLSKEDQQPGFFDFLKGAEESFHGG